MFRVSMLTKTSPTQSKNNLPLWMQMAVIFGVEIAKDALVASATATMGPVGTTISEFIANASAGVIEDMLIGNNPWSKDNLFFSFGFPAMRLVRKINTIKRFNRSFLGEIARVTAKKEEKELFQLHQDLSNMKWGKLRNENERNFTRIMEPYKKSGLLKDLAVNIDKFPEKINHEKQLMDLAEKRVRTLGKGVSIFNRAISFTSPNYAARYLVGKLTRRFKEEINEHIKNWWKKFGGTVSKVNEFFYRTVIPLHHTGKPWIAGIRIFQVQRLSLLFNVEFVFCPWITNFKKPVWIYNKKMEDIREILTAPSAGQYYINNIAWGWDVGKLIRKSGAMKAGYFLTSFSPLASSVVSIGVRAYHSIERSKNIQKNLEEYNHFDKILQNALIGLQHGIKGERAIRSVGETLITGKTIYAKHYMAQKARRAIYLRTRSHTRNTLKRIAFKNYGKWG